MTDMRTASKTTFKIPSLRWWIAAVLLLGAALNYLDRSILGLLAPTIQKDLHITDPQYASVVNYFLVAYTVAYLFSGRIVDRIGERLSMTAFILWWSISNALTGLAHSLSTLRLCRFSLGLGEAGGFTVAPKVVSLWFPARERGLAIGLYSIGGSIGATIAPFLVTSISERFGWRWVFSVTPILALLWISLWLTLYHRPDEHPLLTERERSYLLASREPEPPAETVASEPPMALWRTVLSQSSVWRLMLGRLLTDPVWYFYQFWMAKYLFTVRHLNQHQLSVMWMIFLAADIGFLGGGYFAGRLINRGVSAVDGRSRIMLISACIVPFACLIPGSPTLDTVLVLSVIVVAAQTSWLSNISAVVVDVIPQRILATSFGLIACGSAIGGIFMNQLVSWTIGNHSYSYCFYMMVFLHPIALLIVWPLRRFTKRDSRVEAHE